MADRTIKIRYSAPSNITFHGCMDTGILESDWAQMTSEEQDWVVLEELCNLLDLSEET